MRKEELEVGVVYMAKHGGGLCSVKLLEIKTIPGYRNPHMGMSRPSVTRYVCKKLGTGNTVVFKSPQKFIRKAE